MQQDQDQNAPMSVEQAAEWVSELESELEASSDTTIEADAVARARDILHRWVDTVTGVVSTPGVGRVVLIHESGRRSGISSSDLPIQLAAPVRFRGD